MLCWCNEGGSKPQRRFLPLLLILDGHQNFSRWALAEFTESPQISRYPQYYLHDFGKSFILFSQNSSGDYGMWRTFEAGSETIAASRLILLSCWWPILFGSASEDVSSPNKRWTGQKPPTRLSRMLCVSTLLLLFASSLLIAILLQHYSDPLPQNRRGSPLQAPATALSTSPLHSLHINMVSVGAHAHAAAAPWPCQIPKR
jgi:hypothetical protein